VSAHRNWLTDEGLGSNWACRDPDHRDTGGNVAGDDGICPDPRMVANIDGADEAGPGAHVDVPAKARHSAVGIADRNLLKEQAVGANLRIGVDDDAVWMRDQKTSANLACQRNVGTAHRRPKSVSKNGQSGTQAASAITCTMIVSYAF
jgi:hypothetical protein